MQRRSEGYLPSKKGKYNDMQFLFFDTESYIKQVNETTKILPLRLGITIYHSFDKNGNTKKRHIYRFNTIQGFIDTLQQYVSSRKALFVVAHNIPYDIRVLNLPHEFNRLGWESEPPILNERLFIWRVKTPKGNIVFIDTANYAVQSVRQLGKDLKFDKMDIDLMTLDDEELYKYCQRDVEVIEKFMLHFIQFVSDNNLGTFQLSLASQALTAYQTSLMEGKIYIHNNPKALQIEREAYHGGRVEVFKMGEFNHGDYYYLDVNSLYPYCMATYPVPTRLFQIRDNPSMGYLNARLERDYIIADVVVNTNEPVYPIIIDNKLIFPVGEFRVQLHHRELEYALSKGHVIHTLHSAHYKSEIIFGKYVEFFYKIKQQSSIDGNASWRFISKIFLNALYGKFGQLQVHREELKDINKNDKHLRERDFSKLKDWYNNSPDNVIWRLPVGSQKTGKTFQEIFWFGKLWREFREGECNHSNPAIAGSITANARMLLYNYILACGWENVYYVDTDSIITNIHGYKRLENVINHNELGYLKLENTAREIEIRGCKDYRFGNDNKIKGVPHSAQLTKENRWRYEQFQGFITWLNNGGNHTPEVYLKEKSRKSEYNKGKPQPDGNVLPLTVATSYEDNCRNYLVE